MLKTVSAAHMPAGARHERWAETSLRFLFPAFLRFFGSHLSPPLSSAFAQVREGELVFGVAHIFASFNDTFVHVTDLSGK